MTRQQMQWAEQHDWFVSAGGAKGRPFSWVVKVRPSFKGDTETVFKDFTKLRHWAGY